MLEWLSSNPWALWFALALVLGAIETATGDLTLAMLAVGALAGMVVAFALPGLIPAQAIVAAVVAVSTLIFVRPGLRKRFRDVTGYRSSVSVGTGSSGFVVRPVTSGGGEVRVNGENWSARTPDNITIEQGQKIYVLDVDGVTLVVHPFDELMP